MKKITIFVLNPDSPFHIGSQGVDMEATSDMLHSDTLFSALCHAYLQMGKEVPQQEWPLHLSSVFPVIADRSIEYSHRSISRGDFQTGLYLVPRPFLDLEPWLPVEGKPSASRKSWKNIRWISLSILEMLRKGQLLQNPAVAHEGEILLTAAEKERYFPYQAPLWKSGLEGIVPRVKIDRLHNLSQLYHVGRTHFAPRVGLYFMVDGPEDEIRKILPALEILADSGIGGERTYGYGLFNYLGEHTLTFEETEGSRFLLLSLFHPANADEVKSALSYPALYQLSERRGFMDSPQGRNFRRQNVLMVTEGSLLSGEPQGNIPDVRPERTKTLITHPVFRYGRAFTLPGQYAVKEEA